jgi:2-iminobutanoate/2-iminopropanoate deaminase
MKHIILSLLVLITLNVGFSQDLKVITPPTAPKPIGPYSHALMKGEMLFVSGQIAINAQTGKADTATIENEINRVMQNIEAILKEAGLWWSNVMKTTIYTTDLKYFETINKIYSSYLKEPFPARETVQVAALPKKMHVEISVTAMK